MYTQSYQCTIFIESHNSSDLIFSYFKKRISKNYYKDKVVTCNVSYCNPFILLIKLESDSFFSLLYQWAYAIYWDFLLLPVEWRCCTSCLLLVCWNSKSTDTQRLNSQWEGWEDLLKEAFLLLSLFESVFQGGEFDPNDSQPFSLHTTETSCQSQCSYCTEMGWSLSGCSQSCPCKKRWAWRRRVRGGRCSYTLEPPEEVLSLLGQVCGWEVLSENISYSCPLYGWDWWGSALKKQQKKHQLLMDLFY